MATKTSGKRSTAAKNDVTPKQQFLAIIFFALTILLMCIVIIKGQNVWTMAHDAMFGIFGVMAYVYPLVIGLIAILTVLNRKKAKIYVKSILVGVLALFIGATIDIIGGVHNCEFLEYISSAYTNGVAHKFAGFLGGIIGHPLYLLCGKTGAIIVTVLVAFVLFMVITGTTLSALYNALKKPVETISDKAENAYKERTMAKQAEITEQQPKKGLKIIKGFNVDIPVDDIPVEREGVALTLEDKQKKLVESYTGEEMPEEKTSKRRTKTVPDEVMSNALNGEEASHEKLTPDNSIVNDIKSGLEVNGEEVYKYPPIRLLTASKTQSTKAVSEELEHTAERLVDTLRSFGVETRIVDISRGPSVTRYELQPCAGVKISKITNLADDIALNLAAAGVRIEAPIPNKAAVGIEVPNKAGAIVGVREIIESPAFTAAKSKLTIAMGRDIGGNVVTTDIAKMPHGLIAGATGSGKSVCINSMIISLLYKASPDEVKLLMIDPKVVELGIYNGIPHLLVPVVTDPRKAAGALGWAVSEMEKRYKMFADRGVRDLEGYNKFVEELNDPEYPKMPHIVIIIDELADLMMTAPNEVEDSINRIAAKARAAGMHLIVATQRPSVDVVTGVIKANIPTRIAFAVSSQVDSRTILDSVGAEKLLGKGDMLFSPMGATKPNRLQGCFVSDAEVEAVVNYIKTSGKTEATYDDNIMQEIERQAVLEKKQKQGFEESNGDGDPMLDEAIRVVVENGQASTSLLQRKLKLGYARAARIVDEMEERGVVGPYEGSKPRKVLITKEELMEREAGTE